MSKIHNMTEKQSPSYPLRMPQELREQLAEVAKANGRSMNAEIIAMLQGSLEIKHPDRIAVDTAQGIKVYAPESELPSADDIAEKVIDRLKKPVDIALTESLLNLLERREQRFREHWIKEFGYDPEQPALPQHGGPPAKSPNARKRITRTRSKKI